jgi:flagellar protein FlaI
MRPDRIVVGEVRGGEVETLFNSMNVGLRGVLGTMHANNSRDAVKKLEEAPMNVPRGLIPLLNVIIVQSLFFDRSEGRSVRRVVQVSEVSKIEREVTLNDVFRLNSSTMKLERTDYSSEALEKISKAVGRSLIELNEELGKRRAVLDYLVEKGVSSFRDVNDFMSGYYQKEV